MYDKVLDTFKAVAEEGSFTKASEKLYITHTAIRKQIDQLESGLGVKLFDRSNQGVKLTSAGQVMYAETLRIIKESETAIHRVKDAFRQKKMLQLMQNMLQKSRNTKQKSESCTILLLPLMVKKCMLRQKMKSLLLQTGVLSLTLQSL